MDELLLQIETEIALITKHIAEDHDRTGDAILGQFYRGRLVVEEQQIKVLKRLWETASKI